MLHILWMILKIILIVIGILLGLVLLALLLVLFCPVRYRAQAEKASPSFSEAKLEASVSWLFHLIRVKVLFQNGDLSPDVRIFGIPILKLLKKKEPASERKPEPEKAKEPENGSEPVKIPEPEKEPESVKIPEPEKEPETKAETVVPEIPAEAPDSVQSKRDIPVLPAEEQRTEPEAGRPEAQQTEAEAAEKNPFYRSLWNKIRAVWGKIIGIPRKIAETVRKIALSIRAVYDKIDWWKQFLTHPRTKEAVAYVKKRAGRVIRHVFPTKIRGEITFGSEDPSVTGTVLAVLGMTIPFHKNYVMVSPVFQSENILEGNVWLKGRIYGIVLVKAALEIYFNKNVKYVIYRWKKHKEG